MKDSTPTTGIFENHYVVFSLPEISGKKPATSYCIEIPAGGTLDVSSNKYKCNFFEFAASGGSSVGTTPGSDGKGNPATCNFDGASGVRALTCIYSYSEGAVTKSHACSAYKDTLQDASGKPAALIQVKNDSKPFQGEAINTAGLGNSAAGSPYPAATQIAIAEGNCEAGKKQLQPGSVAPGSPAAGKTVTFELKPTATTTAIKTSSGQSSSLQEGTTKCTITKPASGTVTVTAEPVTTSPSGSEKHFVVSKLISVTDASQTKLCTDFITKNSTGSIYLFGDHWTQK